MHPLMVRELLHEKSDAARNSVLDPRMLSSSMGSGELTKPTSDKNKRPATRMRLEESTLAA